MKRSKSGLFLMEMMFAILFFSVAGAVCLQLFAKAHMLSRDAALLNEAVTHCQSAAAILENDGMDALPEYFGGSPAQSGSYLVRLDGSYDCWLRVTEDDSAYHISALRPDTNESVFALELTKKNR